MGTPLAGKLGACAGLVLRANAHPDLARHKVAERPKVTHNPATGLFVMWLHIDTADYELARTGVAVAKHPTGPFQYRGSFRPHGQQARDLTIFRVLHLLLCTQYACMLCQSAEIYLAMCTPSNAGIDMYGLLVSISSVITLLRHDET